MTLKDLTAYLSPNLKLPWKDHVFEVAPPSKQDGLLLAALNAAGIAQYMNMAAPCEACGRAAETHEISDDFKNLMESAANRDLGEISLGGAYQEMQDLGVPGADIDMFALYAFYFWTLGEESADAILDARYGGGGDDSDPKGNHPKPSQSGQSSE